MTKPTTTGTEVARRGPPRKRVRVAAWLGLFMAMGALAACLPPSLDFDLRTDFVSVSDGWLG